jgi:hypothetical protein
MAFLRACSAAPKLLSALWFLPNSKYITGFELSISKIKYFGFKVHVLDSSLCSE